MKFFKKVLSLVVFIMLIGSFTTGCKKSAPKETSAKSNTTGKVTKTNETVSKSSTTNKKSAQTNVKSEETSEEANIDDNRQSEIQNEDSSAEPQLIDMGGRTLSVRFWFDIPNRAGYEQYNIIIPIIESKYNVRIIWETYPAGDRIADTKTRFLSGTMTNDVLHVSDGMIFPWAVSNKMIASLEDTVTDPDAWDRLSGQLGTFSEWIDKKHYGMWNVDTRHLDGCTAYNYKLFEQSGIPDINDYYVNNNMWNWASFLDIAQKLTRDIDGDGITDQWGLACVNTNSMALRLLDSNDARLVSTDSMGQKVSFSLYDQKALNALQFFSDLYNVYKVIAPNANQTLLKQRKAAMAVMEPWMVRYCNDVMGDQDFYISFLPKGPDAQNYSNGTLNTARFFAFPSFTTNLNDVITVWTDLCNTYDEAVGYQIPGREHESRIAMALSNNISNEKNLAWYSKYGIPGVYTHSSVYGKLDTILNTQLFAKIYKLELSVAQGLSSVQSAAQAEIDNILK